MAGRKPGKRKPRARYGLVVEGKVTERVYFEKLRSMLHVSNDVFVITHNDNYTNLREMIKGIEAEIERRKSLKKPPVESWWVLGDTEHSLAVGEAQELLSLAKKHKATVAIDDPSVEVWLLLHFQDVRKPYTDAGEVIRDLQKFIPDYDEPSKDPHFEEIVEAIPMAVNRAQRLRERHLNHRDVSELPRVDADIVVGLLNHCARSEYRIIADKKPCSEDLALQLQVHGLQEK